MRAYYRYFLFLVALAAPFLFRDYSPDNELRYISIAEEALRNRTWFTFYNHGEIYADKPPLYFWLVMLAKEATGAYRMAVIGLLSVLPAIGVCWLMDRWMRLEFSRFDSATAGFLLITTGFFLGSALVLRMDMLMCFFICLSLYLFFRLYTGKAGRFDKWGLPVCIFLALFTKGPVGLLVPLISMTVFLGLRKKLRKMGDYFGAPQWGVLLLLCVVWMCLVYLEGGKEYLENILFRQTVGRGIHSFRHSQPVYYYVKHLPLTFLPWTFLYLFVLSSGAWKRLAVTDTERLFAVVIVSTFVFLSLVSSKLDIYLLPVYPFVAYLTVSWMQRLGDTGYVRAGVWIPAVVLAAAFPASFFLDGLLPFPYRGTAAEQAAFFLASAGGVAGAVFLLRKQTVRAIRSVAAGVLSFLFVFSFSLPRYNAYVGLRELAAEGKEMASHVPLPAYAFYKFRDGECMDVYLGVPPVNLQTVEELERLKLSTVPVVLFIGYWELEREPGLRQWLGRQRDVRQVGRYRVLMLGKERESE